jgi:protein TonB
MRQKEYYKVYYHNTVMISLSIVILLFLTAFNITWEGDEVIPYEMDEQEVVQMEQVEITQQLKTPPPPPRPQVPVEVPDEEVIEDEIIDLNADLDLDAPLDLPPPPPPVEDDEPEIFVVVEQQPEVVGGMKSIYKNLKYPDIARKAGIEGRVILQFIVDEKGNVIDPQVVRGIGGGCDEQAIEAVKKVTFKPGMQRGRPVKVRFSLPIVFKLQN